jgi:hypothetical protein
LFDGLSAPVTSQTHTWLRTPVCDFRFNILRQLIELFGQQNQFCTTGQRPGLLSLSPEVLCQYSVVLRRTHCCRLKLHVHRHFDTDQTRQRSRRRHDKDDGDVARWQQFAAHHSSA